MDFYYKKKLKSSKSNNENLADVLNDVERKYMDMQPIIQDPVGDKSKIQGTLSEIRAQVDYLQTIGGTVGEEQQQRIKEITRKYKEVSVKYDNPTELSASDIKSPRLFQRKVPSEPGREPVQVLQNRVVLGEVEEKLKSMRQKRLDRLSTFVAEQSKLSEERSNQNNDASEIEDAIRTIQKTDAEKKITFKSIVEENYIETVIKEEVEREDHSAKVSPKLVRNRSNESTDKFKNSAKASSTRKFINKLNCTTQVDHSSSEDLNLDTDNAKTLTVKNFKPEECKFEAFSRDRIERHSDGIGTHAIFKTHFVQKYKAESSGIKNKVTENVFISSRNSLESPPRLNYEGTEEIQHNESDSYSPLLIPTGKQRKAVYLYEHECDFLENEKRVSLPSLTTFGKEENISANTKDKSHRSYEDRDIIAMTNFENPLLIQSTNSQLGKTFGKIHHQEESGRIQSTDSQVGKTFGKINHQEETGRKSDDYPKHQLHVYENKDIVTNNETKRFPGGNEATLDKKYKEEVAIGSTVVSRTYENIIKNKSKKFTPTEVAVGQIETDRNSKHRKSDPVEGNKLSFIRTNKAKDLAVKIETNRKSNGDLYEDVRIPKSPMPLPRRSNNAERILKKLQRNWESVNEILENDSDVDCDEIEDLRKTWAEADVLLNEYKTRLKKLEVKTRKEADNDKLRDVKVQLEAIENDILEFKGLRRDSAYKQLSSRLSNYFLEINKMNSNDDEVLSEKKTVLNYIERYIKMLESRVTRNEAVLLEILDEQVKSIGTNCLSITKV